MKRKVVFIIGGSRTGSELLKGILEKYSSLSFVNEMHLLAPFWLRKDFKSVLQANFNNSDSESLPLDDILLLSKRNQLEGHYWQKEFAHKVDLEIFKKTYGATDMHLKDVLFAAMTEKMISNKKDSLGAKFPVHYSYTKLLQRWFPESLLIHTIRDPRAVYYSQSRKYLRSKELSVVKIFKIILQYIHIVIQSNWTALLHLQYKTEKNYFPVNYEDMVKQPTRFFPKLCEFLDIEYQAEMSQGGVYSNSSFSGDEGKGKPLDIQSISKWRDKMTFPEKFIITLCVLPALYIYGYEL